MDVVEPEAVDAEPERPLIGTVALGVAAVVGAAMGVAIGMDPHGPSLALLMTSVGAQMALLPAAVDDDDIPGFDADDSEVPAMGMPHFSKADTIPDPKDENWGGAGAEHHHHNPKVVVVPRHYIDALGVEHNTLGISSGPKRFAHNLERFNKPAVRDELIEGAGKCMAPDTADLAWRFATYASCARLHRFRNGFGRITNIPIGTGEHHEIDAYVLREYLRHSDWFPERDANLTIDLVDFLAAHPTAHSEMDAETASRISAEARVAAAQARKPAGRYHGFTGQRLVRYSPPAALTNLIEYYHQNQNDAQDPLVDDMRTVMRECNYEQFAAVAGRNEAEVHQTFRMNCFFETQRVMNDAAPAKAAYRAQFDALSAGKRELLHEFHSEVMRRFVRRRDARRDGADGGGAKKGGARSKGGAAAAAAAADDGADDRGTIFAFFKRMVRETPRILDAFEDITSHKMPADDIPQFDNIERDVTSPMAMFYSVVVRASEAFATQALLTRANLDRPVDPVSRAALARQKNALHIAVRDARDLNAVAAEDGAAAGAPDNTRAAVILRRRQRVLDRARAEGVNDESGPFHALADAAAASEHMHVEKWADAVQDGKTVQLAITLAQRPRDDVVASARQKYQALLTDTAHRLYAMQSQGHNSRAATRAPVIFSDCTHHINPLLPLYNGTRLLHMCIGEAWARWGLSESWMPRSAIVRAARHGGHPAQFDMPIITAHEEGINDVAELAHVDDSSLADRIALSTDRFRRHMGLPRPDGLGCVIVSFYTREIAPVAIIAPDRFECKAWPAADPIPGEDKPIDLDIVGDGAEGGKENSTTRYRAFRNARTVLNNHLLAHAHGGGDDATKRMDEARERTYYHYVEMRGDKYKSLSRANSSVSQMQSAPFFDPDVQFRQGERLRLHHREIWDAAQVLNECERTRAPHWTLRHPRVVVPDKLMALRLAAQAQTQDVHTAADLEIADASPYNPKNPRPVHIPVCRPPGTRFPPADILDALMPPSDFPPDMIITDRAGPNAQREKRTHEYLTAARHRSRISEAIAERDARLPYYEREMLLSVDRDRVLPVGRPPSAPPGNHARPIEEMFFCESLVGQIYAVVQHNEARRRLSRVDADVPDVPPIIHLDCVMRRTLVEPDDGKAEAREAYVVDTIGPGVKQTLAATGTEDMLRPMTRNEMYAGKEGKETATNAFIGLFERPTIEAHRPFFRGVCELDLLGAHAYDRRFCTVPFYAFNDRPDAPAGSAAALARNDDPAAERERVRVNENTGERRSGRARWLLNALRAAIGPVVSPPQPVPRVRDGKHAAWTKRECTKAGVLSRVVVPAVTFRYDESSMTASERVHFSDTPNEKKAAAIAARLESDGWRQHTLDTRDAQLHDETRYQRTRDTNSVEDIEPPERSLTILMQYLFTCEATTGNHTVRTTTPLYPLYRWAFRPHAAIEQAAAQIKVDDAPTDVHPGARRDRLALVAFDGVARGHVAPRRIMVARRTHGGAAAAAAAGDEDDGGTHALSALDPRVRNTGARINDLGWLHPDGGGADTSAFVITSVLDAVRVSWTAYSRSVPYLHRPTITSRVIVATRTADDVVYTVFVYRPGDDGVWIAYLFPDTFARRKDAIGAPDDATGTDPLRDRRWNSAEVTACMDAANTTCYCILDGMGSQVGSKEDEGVPRLACTRIPERQRGPVAHGDAEALVAFDFAGKLAVLPDAMDPINGFADIHDDGDGYDARMEMNMVLEGIAREEPVYADDDDLDIVGFH